MNNYAIYRQPLSEQTIHIKRPKALPKGTVAVSHNGIDFTPVNKAVLPMRYVRLADGSHMRIHSMQDNTGLALRVSKVTAAHMEMVRRERMYG